MPKPHVLIVEDDKAVRNLLSTALEINGYAYRSAETGMISLQEALSHKPDVILLDLGLPDMDGMDVLQKIRSWSQVPILVVSARGEDKDKIDAFDAGADDYVTKPFSVDELMARVRAALRRTRHKADTAATDSVFCNGDLRIDLAAGRAFLGQAELHLTPLEYKLLCLLAKHAGKVLTHQFLFKELWGRSTDSETSHLRVFMASLRKKIEGPAQSGQGGQQGPREQGQGEQGQGEQGETRCGTQYFQTHMGVGYRMILVGE